MVVASKKLVVYVLNRKAFKMYELNPCSRACFNEVKGLTLEFDLVFIIVDRKKGVF